MTYTPDASVLRGLSMDKASLYGMPHIGCRYTRDDMARTAFESDLRCAWCGSQRGFHSRHHEPPRSNGSFLLNTPKGKFVLLPALVDLCGSGTTGCHGDRHNGLLKLRWEWDGDEFAEKWWDGTFLSRPYHEPNGKWLYAYGCWVLERDGVERRFRGQEQG